jgi:hypothetical protein
MHMACLSVSEREATEVANELATSLAPADWCQRACHIQDHGYHVLIEVTRISGGECLPIFQASRNAKRVPMANR